MIFDNLSESQLAELLIQAVDVWRPGDSGQLNPVEIFHHWRGRPSDSSPSRITFLECARVAWRRARNDAHAFDNLQKQATRLLKLDTEHWYKAPRNHLFFSFEIAKALAHVCLAAGYWHHQKTHQNAYEHLALAADLYQVAWPIGLRPYVDFSAFHASSELPNLRDAAKSIPELLVRTFGPLNSHAVPITGTTYMILYELLSVIMGHQRSGPRTQMHGLFVGPDGRDPEYEIGHVLDMTVRRLPAPVLSFCLDPVSLGVTFIDKSMRDSLRAAWRCCLFECDVSQPFSLRIELQIANPRVGILTGASAGGLVAAMMCAARDEIELSTNLSATCRLQLSKQDRECQDSIPLDPHRVVLGPILGAIPKLRQAWLGHGVDEVYLHRDNFDEWERAKQPGPRAGLASNLADLVTKLNRDQPLWDRLKQTALVGLNRWDELIAHQGQPRGGPDQRHRLDLYVPPLLRVEGEPRQYVEAQPSKDISQSLLVPGDELSDQPLLQVLALALGGEKEVDWERWKAANAEGENDEENDADDLAEESDSEHEETDHVDPNDADRSLTTTQAAPSWVGPGRDLLIYDVAGAGKSVLTLRIAHLLNDSTRWQAMFDTKQPTLVLRIEGVWPTRDGQLLPLREMVYETLAYQVSHPSPTQTNALREDEKPQIRQAVEFAFAKRRLVLIVDGFDQFSSIARDHIVAEHDTNDGRDCRWIVASRQHTIATLFGSSRRQQDWMRVRIEPFNTRQRDEFFRRAGLKQVWRQYVNPDSEAMAEMLQLPVVLDQLREFIENRIEAAKESERDPEPAAFESLSQLALVTSRLSLERALDPQKLADLKAPDHLKDVPSQLKAVEHVLSLIAFELLLQARGESSDEWNGMVRGKGKKEKFLEACQDRYHRPVDLQLFTLESRLKPALGDSRKIETLIEQSAKDRLTWHWAMAVLDRVELNHRSYFEQHGEDILAFRDRKSVEFYAARYLTCFAREWDIFAEYPEDKRTIEEEDAACAWQRIADPQWANTWQLAIAMPQEPLPGTIEHTFRGAVLDPWSTCLSLSALFRPTLDGKRRPTKLLWQCWPMFEFDERRALDGRYRFEGKLVTGHELAARGLDADLRALASRQLLSDHDDGTRVRDARDACLTKFRQSSRDLVQKFDFRMGGILANDGTRHPIPADKESLETLLAEWQQQSHLEKSLTFLPCPPPAWILAHESDPANHRDPRVNSAIKGHEDEAVKPFLMQATPVTRGMFYEFDPHFRIRLAIADSLAHEPWQDFPMVDASWFDAFAFCKWLGPSYRLPNEFEWEIAARAGTQTEYHFGDRLSGDLANCNGRRPHPEDANHPTRECLRGCSPVGLAKYAYCLWGLFDVHGNVWEWCENWSHAEGSRRVIRGGSWYRGAAYCLSGYRRRSSPDSRGNGLGFRVSLVPSSQPESSNSLGRRPGGSAAEPRPEEP